MRELRIRDTLSGEIRPLQAKEPGKVGIYACGPTTYGPIHVGNARPYVVFTLLKRFLEHEGYEPTLVVNVTDINDKIYAAAREQGVASDQWAREMTDAYVADTDRLGLGRPDAEPLASETIPEIVALIEALIEREHAYESGGDVYFRVRSFPGYGKLSNNRPEDMDQGEEAGSAELKEDQLDFALWKATKEDEDTSWESPWGKGRPGWHIECSAMAEKLLGLDFAIHGGGLDLVFPHHENEIAQTEAGRGEPLARIWMHNGMLQLDAEKMSKSVGNIFQLSEALDRYGAAARGRATWSRVTTGSRSSSARRRWRRRGGGWSGSGTSCAERGSDPNDRPGLSLRADPSALDPSSLSAGSVPRRSFRRLQHALALSPSCST